MRDSKQKLSAFKTKAIGRKEKETARVEERHESGDAFKDRKKPYNLIAPNLGKAKANEESRLNLSALEKQRRREDSKYAHENVSERSNVMRERERPMTAVELTDAKSFLEEYQLKVNEFMLRQFPGLLAREIGLRQYLDALVKFIDRLLHSSSSPVNGLLLKVNQLIRPLREIGANEPLELELNRLRVENQLLREKEEKLLSEGSVVLPQEKLAKLNLDNAKCREDLRRVREDRRKFEQVAAKLNRLIYEIRKQGVDVDGIYQKCVRGKEPGELSFGENNN